MSFAMQDNTNTSAAKVPYGFCHCGCGQRTRIATETHKRDGHIKGQPVAYLRGHNNRGRDPEERFWSKVDKSAGPDACWPWLAYKGKGGYGRCGGFEPEVLAHRIAWILANGPLEPGNDIRHKTCDNPPCCNPAHLEPGTHAQNMADMVSRGRAARGERNAKTKLTQVNKDAIRQLYATGTVTQRELARQHSVDRQTIRKVIHGDS
jgi:hypothetical protein